MLSIKASSSSLSSELANKWHRRYLEKLMDKGEQFPCSVWSRTVLASPHNCILSWPHKCVACKTFSPQKRDTRIQGWKQIFVGKILQRYSARKIFFSNLSIQLKIAAHVAGVTAFIPASQWKNVSWHGSAVSRRDDDSFLRVQIAFVLQMKTLLP